ncbi:MAG: rhomboid family intramembrane serine protease [Planctomycetia bacterium]|nr:rhomboid family intramembrane serine protease [Planctomycetia bacterium]
MGFQDRDYYRDPYSPPTYRKERSAIFYIIMLNVIIWILDAITDRQFSAALCLRAADVIEPLNWYRFLTHGFCHATDPMHIIGNMFGLFFLGRAVEARYGRREFTFFYLVAIIIGGFYWAGGNYYSVVANQDSMTAMEKAYALYTPCVGASGGVTAVIILFALNFPKVTVLIWGLLPMPAFALGILIVVMDLMGSQNQNTNIAHSVHLAGAGFALLYYVSRFRFTSIFGHGRPKVQAWDGNYDEPLNRSRNGYGSNGYGNSAYSNYDQNRDYEDDYEDDSYGYAPPSSSAEELRREEEMRQLQKEVDALLRKISMSGMQSLTPSELARLREASQKFRERR